MNPKAHLFVVDNDTLPLHIQKGFCGIIRIRDDSQARFGQLADLMNVKVGDLVFFYMMSKSKCFFQPSAPLKELEQGYYGVFRVTGEPYADESEVQGEAPFENYYIFGAVTNPHYSSFTVTRTDSRGKGTYEATPTVLYYRIPIEPVESYEENFQQKFVDDNHAYVDKTDEGNLWTLFFKKIKRVGEERSITPILPEESSKVARLLFKQKQRNVDAPLFPVHPLARPSTARPIELVLNSNGRGELTHEAMLEGFILRELNRGTGRGVLFDEIIGSLDDIEFTGNQIQYGISGNKVDILVLHKKNLGGSINYRYKATVIELKKSALTKGDLEQIIDYRKWIAQLTTFNDQRAIQPVLISKKPSPRMQPATKKAMRDALDEIEKSGISAPRFLEYTLVEKAGVVSGITFSEYDISSYL